MTSTGVPDGFWTRPVTEIARDLVGMTLLVDGCGGVIVETEAYDRDDPASHSFSGLTRRNASMFGLPGHAYVYRSYGIHWCFNIVCGSVPGGAVLIRALYPIFGLEAMRLRRGAIRLRDLCRGPGRVCQALGITGGMDGLSVSRPPFDLQPRHKTGEASDLIAAGPRIGITRATETPWRFYQAESVFVSGSRSSRVLINEAGK
ncbi:DNA-3-methyladenine glycosylase [Granulibacter bethesdensis]|uniref:DNA-3-methyladenine glycosylase n=1 Tax=Granulibacter bethesdensis TaxID=364410 RepID=UPI001E6389A4|nr:DNA-3-methyladenine glycosylase [Granulibacter bethesdensis]